MTKTSSIEFARRYHIALRVFLRQRPRGRRPSHAAEALGRAALAMGINTLDVARTHHTAAKALTHVAARPATDPARPVATEAGRFLVEVITPMTPSRRAVRRVATHLQRLELLQQRGAAARATARRKFHRELARRKTCEHRLLRATRHYILLLAQSRRMQKQSRRLAQQILSAQEEERKNISRELHDEVAQILAGINVHLAALREAAMINGRTLPKRIAQTQRLVEHSIEAVHRYARELRPALLDDLGLIPALRSFIRTLSANRGLRIRFSAFPEVDTLDNSRRTVLFRVAQEALTNVARHAHARNVTVRIRRIEHTVRLEVHDDGSSFRVERVMNSNSNRRLGLLGMRERVEMVGGKFSIRSAPKLGTTVRAEIPLPAPVTPGAPEQNHPAG